MDVLVHGMTTAQQPHDAVTGEHVAHLLGIAGMTVVLAGVVIHGARRSRRPRAALEGGLDHNAHR